MKCETCGESQATEGLEGIPRCEPCHSDETIWCDVCQTDEEREEPCCHLQWWEEGGDWIGSGRGYPCWCNDIRTSMHVVCDEVGDDIAAQLLAALQAHDCSACLCGPFMGRPSISVVLRQEEFGRCFSRNAYNDDDLETAMTAGMLWLMSLETSKTQRADDLAAAWVAEWAACKRTEAL